VTTKKAFPINTSINEFSESSRSLKNSFIEASVPNMSLVEDLLFHLFFDPLFKVGFWWNWNSKLLLDSKLATG